MPGVDQIRQALEKAKLGLLDLSTRNRLLHVPLDRARSKSVLIVNERAEDVFRILVEEQKGMNFASSRKSSSAQTVESHQSLLGEPTQESHETHSAPVSSERYVARLLQTALEAESMQRRLLGIYYDARTFEE